MRHEQDPNRAPSKWPWALAWCGVVIAIAWAGWTIGSAYWKQQNALLGEIPALKTVLNDTKKRVEEADQRWRDWDSRHREIAQEMDGLRGEVTKKLRAASVQAQRATDGIMTKVQAELARQVTPLNTRLTNWEAQHEQDSARIATLDKQVAGLRQQLVQQQSRLAAIEHQSGDEHKALAGEVAMVRETAAAGRKEVGELAKSLVPRRVDFELTKNHSQYLVPGVAVCVNHTDRLHREVSGYLWVMPDRKTVWFKNQSALEPIFYYSDEDGKLREVVFTAVSDRGATGYLLLPASQSVQLNAMRTDKANVQ